MCLVHALAGGKLNKTAGVCWPDLVRGGVFRNPKIALTVGVALLARLMRFIVLKKRGIAIRRGPHSLGPTNTCG